MTPPLTVLVPMGLEARALHAGAPDLDLRRTGVGPRRAARAAHAVSAPGPVLLAGFCGALDTRLQPGEIVLADRLQTPGGTLALPDPSLLAATLRHGGLSVHVGPLACTRAPLAGAHRRRALAEAGALAVDMESAAVARALPPGQWLAVLRVVLDTPHHELHRPLRVLRATRRAGATLRRAAALLEDWRQALGDREVVLANPRASCAGVERAVEVVERVLEDRGAPVYVRKQIVHNAHVIAELERRGAVFVDELAQVPEGSTVIFSAHGVSPAVRAHAAARELEVIDATCPLVAKVHAEARRFSRRGFDIVLVGHEGHEEVEGTFGEAPERTHVVASAEEVEQLQLPPGRAVAYLTQTTLAQDETAGVVAALRARFPELAGPPSSDICYATQNRQDAVRALAEECELVLVVGSGNSSNSRRLVEVAERAGVPAVLIEDAGEIPPALLHGRRRIGVTAGASAPESLVQGVVSALSALGETIVRERHVATEQVIFKLPAEVRGPTKEKTWQSP